MFKIFMIYSSLNYPKTEFIFRIFKPSFSVHSRRTYTSYINSEMTPPDKVTTSPPPFPHSISTLYLNQQPLYFLFMYR